MNELPTANELDNTIADLIDAKCTLHHKIRDSEHVYAAKIDRYTRQIDAIVDELEDTRDELFGGIYAQVRGAMITDRQFVYESIMYWHSKGDDIDTIAGNLETSREVLSDIIDEFFME